jgi:hypothetical protein
LRNASGWVSASDDLGNSGFPVWPHPDYAAACASGEWVNNSPQAVDVHEFVNDWLPDMGAKGVSIIVFPTVTMRGVVVKALDLAQRLRNELSQYA